MNMQYITKVLLVVTCVVVILSFGALFVLIIKEPLDNELPPLFPPADSNETSGLVQKFRSNEEFQDYVNKAAEMAQSGYYGGMFAASAPSVAKLDSDAIGNRAGLEFGQKAGLGEVSDWEENVAAVDYSGTNVQVQGIDEPDIVKNNGREIYFSSQNYYYPILRELPMIGGEQLLPPSQSHLGVKSIKAFPPADLKILGKIDKSGDLLLYQDKLLIFSGEYIYGYNIKDPASPQEDWRLKLGSNTALVTARLYGADLYLVVRTDISSDRPCPIKPMVSDAKDLEVRCVDVYHPVAVVPVDTTYTVMKVTAETGVVVDTASFVGTSGSSVAYMSDKALYITYYYPGDFVAFIVNFFQQNPNLVSSAVVDKLVKLRGYDISDSSKLNELQQVLERYFNSLDEDERLRLENELSNKMADYQQEHKRDLEKTGLVKVALNTMQVAASGTVPGTPLNQFALDEYQGNVRIATTVGRSNWFGFGGTNESASDVYVLGGDLKIKGAVKDLGLSERIYAVRFIGDKGYVVTFRQTDPFYVLDLSNPARPALTGELKIPGYSAYLHPINKDLILGVGREGSEVKISLFDVSNAAAPQEDSKYTLNEYWSDILNTHHAFLLDARKEVFFLPGASGGYIFSYQDNNLSLVKAVSGIQAKRALYMNDYLYVVGEDKLIVLNEKDWERVNELELGN